MSRSVVVIGSGVSGTAAAHAAATAGARVTVVVGRPGATSLGSGAIDGATARPFGDHRARVLAFFEALGLWEIGAERCVVATRSGVLREARGRDRAVLDLARTAGGVVAVVDDGRRGWDAKALARVWTSEPWARDRGLQFQPAAVEALRFADEAWLPDADFAERHDDRERVAWLVDRCRRAPDLAGTAAVVMGPWLGLGSGVAEELSRELGKPVGEPLSVPGGVAGLRFDRARGRLFSKVSVELVDGWALHVHPPDGGARARVELESGTVEGDAVVLATGGLGGGGIVFAPEEGKAGFRLSFGCAAPLALRGRPLAPNGSPRGALFESLAWSGQTPACGFERLGVWTDAEGRARDGEGRVVPWLFASGDAAADGPRTLLEAIRSGVEAGTLAATVAGA